MHVVTIGGTTSASSPCTSEVQLPVRVSDVAGHRPCAGWHSPGAPCSFNLGHSAAAAAAGVSLATDTHLRMQESPDSDSDVQIERLGSQKRLKSQRRSQQEVMPIGEPGAKPSYEVGMFTSRSWVGRGARWLDCACCAWAVVCRCSGTTDSSRPWSSTYCSSALWRAHSDSSS